MEAHVVGFAMWVKAVQKAGTVDPDKVNDALPGIEAVSYTHLDVYKRQSSG